MRVTLSRGVVLSLLLLASLALADDARVQELIRQLGDDDPSKREAATHELEKLGDAEEGGSVERAVEEASHDADPERAHRAAEVLRHIRWWDHTAVIRTGAIDVDTGAWLWARPNSFLLDVRRDGRASAAWYCVEGGVMCVDLRKGAPRWVHNDPCAAWPVGGEYLLLLDPASIGRVSLDKGELVWKTALSAHIEAFNHLPVDSGTVAADGDLVCLATMCAYDAASGRQRWAREGLLAEKMLLDGEGVYAVILEDEKHSTFRRFDRATGRDLWKEPLPLYDLGGEILALPRACGLVLVPSSGRDESSWTAAFDTATGERRWTLGRCALAAWAEPEGKRAWIASDQEVTVVDLADGHTVARLPFEEKAEEDCREVSLLVEGPRLYLLRCSMDDVRVRVAGYDIPSRTRVWLADTRGLESKRDSDEWCYTGRLERIGSALVVLDDEPTDPLVVVIDPSNGAVLAHYMPKVDASSKDK